MVLEMMDRLNGNFKYTAEDECLQERFNKLPPYNTNGILSRVGSAFLRKYVWLLPDAGDMAGDSS